MLIGHADNAHRTKQHEEVTKTLHQGTAHMHTGMQWGCIQGDKQGKMTPFVCIR